MNMQAFFAELDQEALQKQVKHEHKKQNLHNNKQNNELKNPTITNANKKNNGKN